MIDDTEKVEKIISKFLEQNCVHEGFIVKEIKNETISTYDGVYPSFEIIYESFDKNSHEFINNLTTQIERFTGLKHKKDYWLWIN